MLFWILQSMVLSIIFILLIHHLIHFFKTTLTIPKMKDLVNAPTQKYDNMYNIIGNPSSDVGTAAAVAAAVAAAAAAGQPIQGSPSSYLPQSIIPSSSSSSFADSFASSSSAIYSQDTMKNELKYFLKNQLNR